MSRSALLICLLLMGGVCHAGHLDFSETTQAIPNGFALQGVSFTWSDPVTLGTFQYGATMDTAAFGVTMLDDPILQGAADGVLAIHFTSPVTALSFAIAVCCGPMTNGIGATVSLDGAGQPVPVTLIEPLQLISQGQFSYTGPPIANFELTFSGAPIFGLDNLAFDMAFSSALSTPEPAYNFLVAAGLFGLAICAGKARARKP